MTQVLGARLRTRFEDRFKLAPVREVPLTVPIVAMWTLIHRAEVAKNEIGPTSLLLLSLPTDWGDARLKIPRASYAHGGKSDHRGIYVWCHLETKLSIRHFRLGKKPSENQVDQRFYWHPMKLLRCAAHCALLLLRTALNPKTPTTRNALFSALSASKRMSTR